MNLNRDIANADAYIARASKNIEKQRRLLTRTRNPQTATGVQNLLDVLVTLLANVQHKRETSPYLPVDGRPVGSTDKLPRATQKA